LLIDGKPLRLCLGTQIIHSGARLSLAAAGSLFVCTTASSGTPLAGGLGWWAIGELLAIHSQAAFEEYANPGRRHRIPGPRSR
jgi:hypothetical protein